MNKQDTYNKLRHNICAGMKIEHKFRQMMVGDEYDWYCTIDEVNEETNNLKVTITGRHGYSHFEDWNMAITVNGLANGEYMEVDHES